MLDRLIKSQGYAIIASSRVGSAGWGTLGADGWAAEQLRAPGPRIAAYVDHLNAGADILVCGGFPNQFQRLREVGLSPSVANDLVRHDILAAREAIARFAESPIPGRQPPGVAAATGSVDVIDHDRRTYGKVVRSDREIRRFHEPTLALFADLGLALVGCAVGSLREAMVVADILEARADLEAYVTLVPRDDRVIADGTSLEVCFANLRTASAVVGLGMSCLPSDLVGPLLVRGRASTDLPLVAALDESVDSIREVDQMTSVVAPWLAGGLRALGPCCGDGLAALRTIRDSLAGKSDGSGA